MSASECACFFWRGQIGAASAAVRAESVAQSAIDAELVLAGLRCLWIPSQRILI